MGSGCGSVGRAFGFDTSWGFLYYIGTSAQMLTKRRGKFVLIFFKKMDQTRPIFVYFCYFHMTNIVQIQ